MCGYAKIVVATLILAAGGLGGPFYLPVFFWGLLPGLIKTLLLFVVGVLVVALLNKFLCKAPLRDRLGGVVGWVAVVGGSMILSVILGIMVLRGLVHLAYLDAQSYVAKAEIVLDSIKAQTGAYPKTLPVDKLGPLPSGLQYGTTDGKIGAFLYFDEDYEGIFTYDTGTKTWHYETGSQFF
jgi:hypothetical protein